MLKNHNKLRQAEQAMRKAQLSIKKKEHAGGYPMVRWSAARHGATI